MPILLDLWNSEKIGINLPVNRNFITTNQSQIYYQFLESCKILTRRIFSKIINIIPSGVIPKTGTIEQKLKEFQDELFLIEITEKEAQTLIEASAPLKMKKMINQPQLQQILKILFPHLNEEVIITQYQKKLLEKNQDSDHTMIKEDIDDIRQFILDINK